MWLLTQTEHVFLYVPNLIGYARVLLGLLSFYYFPSDPLYAMALYGSSCLLDALDGTAARALGQSSRFGAVLDMVTDRCSTTCLMVHLAHRFPSWMLFFQVLISLDLSSHYAHMVSSLSLGSASHKKVGPDTPWLLRLYYEKATVLFLVCAGNEVFFMAWYLMGWSQLMVEGSVSRGIIVALGLVSFPVCLFKQILNGVQLVGASRDLVKADALSRRKGKSKE